MNVDFKILKEANLATHRLTAEGGIAPKRSSLGRIFCCCEGKKYNIDKAIEAITSAAGSFKDTKPSVEDHATAVAALENVNSILTDDQKIDIALLGKKPAVRTNREERTRLEAELFIRSFDKTTKAD